MPDRCQECDGLVIVRASVAGIVGWHTPFMLGELRFAPDWIRERRALHSATCSQGRAPAAPPPDAEEETT